ncbi:hypothetical protein [Streptomyces catenulae]|uniref:Scaffolding protein n=1 Tax=Streptomyces catenulae TaxID=66875 RepID=A0ABV2YY69_9ACTN|nr:hypothetical protein [Streptomyces catenulae]
MPEHSLDETLPTHPRTGELALGLRRDGRPIWPIKGGSGEGGDPAPTGAPNTPPSDAPAPTSSTPPASDPGTAQQLVDAAKRADEAAAERDELRAALDAVTRALNPGADDNAQDPAQLAARVAERDKQLDQVAAELRTARAELAAYKAAGEQGARADRLLNSRAFAEALAALDPDDAKFGEQLAAAITAAVEADPELYRAAPAAPTRSGAEFNGAPAGERRPASLHDAIAARLGG